MKTAFLRRGAIGFALAGLAMVGTGCASPNVNPAAPKANYGYVDLYVAGAEHLAWDVQTYDLAAKEFKSVYHDLDTVEGGPLRLAFHPGAHRLRVTFLNRVIGAPGEIQVNVRAGKIIPVEVKLTEAGVGFVRTKEVSVGGTVYGRYGRRTKIGSDESTIYTVTAAAGEPVAYQLKDRMSYAH
jgi:hypothetical protein